MNAEQAIELLESPSPHKRLVGARFFQGTDLPEVVPQLKGLLSGEKVLHVRSALESAIKRNTRKHSPIIEEDPSEEFELREISQKGVPNKLVGILLHEIEPKVGLIRVAAKSEIPNYENSKTKKHLNSLDMILAGFANLRRAVGPRKSDEFDLADLISEIKSQESLQGVEILLHGENPFLLKSDKNLLHMAVSNGIRNAVEAVSSNHGDKEVIISWEKADIDYRIVILDNGPGVTDNPDALFTVGNTTKTNHGGFGLTIIKQSIENLGGSVTLNKANSGGAKLELRWAI